MATDHSEMLNIYQQSIRNLHILHLAKVLDNEQMDSYSIRRENLRILIADVGSTVELARRADVNATYLSQILSTKTQRNLGAGLARRLERAAKKQAGWMDVAHPQILLSKGAAPIPVVWIPVLSWAQAGESRLPVSIRETAVRLPTTATVAGHALSEHCFALRVTGDAMINPTGRPSYPPGCTIIVDPERTAGNGDRVIVKIESVPEPAFKIYTFDSGRVLLRSLNPQYPALEWRDGMSVLGVVVQTIIDE